MSTLVKQDRVLPRLTSRNADIGAGGRTSYVATGLLLIGAVYCLLPVAWVLIASTKNRAELFSTNTFAPSAHLWDNIVALTQFSNGVYWRWMFNTAIYAGGGALLSVAVSALSGYALAKYEFLS